MNERLTEFYKQAFGYPPAPIGEPELEKFAELVAAAEREACAVLVENYCGAWDDHGYALAQAIRARGEE
jgi:hypothetical protein